jgi:tripartite-type tricarboxylate transporter receptor subunit TctC
VGRDRQGGQYLRGVGEGAQPRDASGFEPQRDSDPEQTRRFVAAEIARWAPIVKGIGLKLD